MAVELVEAACICLLGKQELCNNIMVVPDVMWPRVGRSRANMLDGVHEVTLRAVAGADAVAQDGETGSLFEAEEQVENLVGVLL